MSLPELVTVLELDHSERAALAEALAEWAFRLFVSNPAISIAELDAMLSRHESDYILPAFEHEWKVDL